MRTQQGIQWTRWLVFLGLFILVAGLAVLLPSPAQGDDDDPVVVPPTNPAAHRLYQELSARWWNWAVTEPEATSPLTDTTGEDQGRNQSGPVWFLAGTLGTTETRTVTVPARKALFFPITNAVFWAPEDGATEAEVRRLAREAIDDTRSVECRIDNDPVPHLNRFRVASRAFRLTIAPGSILNEFGYAPGVRSPAVSDGYWVLVRPLERGQHTITFRGTSPGFTTSVHYRLVVR